MRCLISEQARGEGRTAATGILLRRVKWFAFLAVADAEVSEWVGGWYAWEVQQAKIMFQGLLS